MKKLLLLICLSGLLSFLSFAQIEVEGFGWTIIDKKGNTLATKLDYDWIGKFYMGLAAASNPSGYVLINELGQEISQTYDLIEKGIEDYWLFRMNNKEGILNRSGNEVIPASFYSLSNFSDGFIAARKEKDGSYGFIDLQGNWIIHPQYDHIESFSEGLAVVKSGGKYGMVNNEYRQLNTDN